MKVYYNNGDIYKEEIGNLNLEEKEYIHSALNHDGVIGHYYRECINTSKDPLSNIYTKKDGVKKVYKSSYGYRKSLNLLNAQDGVETPEILMDSPIDEFLGIGEYENQDIPPEIYFNVKSYAHIKEIAEYFELPNPLSPSLGDDFDSGKKDWVYRYVKFFKDENKRPLILGSLKLEIETHKPFLYKIYAYKRV